MNKPNYAQDVLWTARDGTVNCISITHCTSPEQARRIAHERALKNQWTPPRWWQWWRWEDTTLKELTTARAE